METEFDVSRILHSDAFWSRLYQGLAMAAFIQAFPTMDAKAVAENAIVHTEFLINEQRRNREE